jgi:hypothetical protein
VTGNVHDLSERFLAVLRGGRKAKHTIDDAEFGAFLMRAIRAWERRVIENPEMLAQNEAMVQRFREITNVAIAANAERYARDPRSAASMAECARILGINKSSASERRAAGRAIMQGRVEAAGAVNFAEARREREALDAAREHAVTHLDGYRARHKRAG